MTVSRTFKHMRGPYEHVLGVYKLLSTVHRPSGRFHTECLHSKVHMYYSFARPLQHVARLLGDVERSLGDVARPVQLSCSEEPTGRVQHEWHGSDWERNKGRWRDAEDIHTRPFLLNGLNKNWIRHKPLLRCPPTWLVRCPPTWLVTIISRLIDSLIGDISFCSARPKKQDLFCVLR